MAQRVTSIDGMGQVNPDLSTTGMGANDHMHLSEDFLFNNNGSTAYAMVPNLALDFRVTQNSTPGKNVLISKGTVYVRNVAWTRANLSQPKYYRITMDADEVVNITSNNTGADRYDLVCAVIDPSVPPGDDGDASFSLAVLTGVGASTLPTIPSDGKSYAVLARVSTANGYTSVLDANIIDNRALTKWAANNDGWIELSGTFTRSSNTRINMPTGYNPTLFINRGDKLRLYDGTFTDPNAGSIVYEYYIVTDVQSTYIDIWRPDSGVLSNNPTRLAYSKETNPFGFSLGSWSPTYSSASGSWTASSSTDYTEFQVVGNYIHFNLRATGTISVNSATLSFTLPLPPYLVSANDLGGGCAITENGVRKSGMWLLTSGSTVTVWKYDSTAFTNTGTLEIQVNGSYRFAL